MAKKHKNRKAIEKRRVQSRQKRTRHKEKAKARVQARENRRQWLAPDEFVGRPPMADIEAPEGFRSIAMAQAMMEYAKPLRELAEQEDVQDLNEILQLSMGLWNFGISSAEAGGQPLENQFIRQIQDVLKLDFQEATDLFKSMVERKDYLFPPDIQPEYPMVMFIRKETSHLIVNFNYDDLVLAEEVIGPDEEDEELIDDIEQMDRYIIDGTDYGEWEDHFFSMRGRCVDRFCLWLQQKGLEEYGTDFSNCPGIYLDFVYCYGHSDIITLQNVSAPYLEEFFADFLLRKVTAEPHEYTYWPPALKLFYTFLLEKGYLENSQPAEQLLNEFEPKFIDLLRRRYS